MYLTKATPLPPPIFDHFWVFGVLKKGGVKTRKKPVKMSLFSQHPASAKYALKLTEILLYREGGISFPQERQRNDFKKGGVKTRKKPVKMSLFSQHPASAKYALKLTEILLYREGVYLVTVGYRYVDGEKHHVDVFVNVKGPKKGGKNP